MIDSRPAVNGIIAAVLSGSFSSAPGALATEASAPVPHVKAKPDAKKPQPPTSAEPKDDALKTESPMRRSAS